MKRLPPAALWAAAVAAGTAFAFWPALDNGFVNWDDPGNIVNNPWLGRFDPAALLELFRSTLYGHFQPLAWLSLSLDKALWGLDPSGFHLTAVLIHSGTSILLFIFLRGLLDDGDDGNFPAAAAAALFSLHPLRVESVAWATERRDLLCLFFLLLSAELYRRAVVRRRAAPDLRWALAAFAGAALSKVFAAVFPALLLVMDMSVLKRKTPFKRLLSEKWGFWALSAAVAALGVHAQAVSGSAPTLARAGWLDRLAIAVWTPGWSLWKTFVPAGLTPLVIVVWRNESYRFWPAAVLTATVLIALFKVRRFRSPLALGAAFFIALSPALGLIKSGPQTSADRFTLIPAVVLSVGAAFLLGRLGRRASWAALSVAVLLAFLSRAQCAVWRDSVTLWTQAARVGPENPMTLGNLAGALRGAGREQEAEALYARLEALAPGDPAALAIAGEARYQAGDWAGAAGFYEGCLRLNPDLPSARVNYGLALYRLGKVPEAAEQFAQAASDAPGLSDAWHDLGIALARMGRYEEADRVLAKALELDATRADTRRARAQVRAALGPIPPGR